MTYNFLKEKHAFRYWQDWEAGNRDYNYTLKLTKLKGCPPAAKLIAMEIQNGTVRK